MSDCGEVGSAEALRGALKAANERITALEAKCDLLAASLKKADERAEGLERDRDAWKETADLMASVRDEQRRRAEQAESERDALRAEVERLREELAGAVDTMRIAKSVLESLPSRVDSTDPEDMRLAAIREVAMALEEARAALAHSEPKGEQR